MAVHNGYQLDNAIGYRVVVRRCLPIRWLGPLRDLTMEVSDRGLADVALQAGFKELADEWVITVAAGAT
jgi:hypothetical protein